MSQVKGAGEVPAGGVVQENPVEKKSIDKRWFAIIGLIVVLVVTLVVLNVISNNMRSTDNADEEFVSYTGIVAGVWTCDDGTEMQFYADRSYIWANTGEGRTEAGDFTEENGRLATNRTALFSNGQLYGSLSEKTYFRVQRDVGILSINKEESELSFVCVRREDA